MYDTTVGQVLNQSVGEGGFPSIGYAAKQQNAMNGGREQPTQKAVRVNILYGTSILWHIFQLLRYPFITPPPITKH